MNYQKYKSITKKEVFHMKKYTIEDMQKIAAFHNGKCLSDTYYNVDTPLQWECEFHHRWFSKPGNVIYGTWCPRCADNLPWTIEELQDVASLKGGTLISTVYKNGKQKLEWECKNNHRFNMSTSNVVNHNQWCPTCGKRARYTVEDMKKVAINYGGEFISKTYNGANQKHDWRCANGHTFQKTPSKIMNCGQWCPKCTHYFNQERCRFIIEYLLGPECTTNRDIISPYELDGFNKELSFAFEYHGLQHYKFVKHFHHSNEDFLRRREIDTKKEQLCKEQNIKLLIIPYDSVENKPNDQLADLLYDLLIKTGVTPVLTPAQVDFSKFGLSLSKIEQLQKIAASKEGQCLSTQYSNDRTKLRWRCKLGHEWNSAPYNIKAGKWCPTCGGSQRLNIDLMRQLAAEKGGECLSNLYINDRTPLKWKCKEGHTWKAIPNSIRQGSWCRKCAKMEKHTQEYVQDYLEKKGGKLLSQYTRLKDKVKVQCNTCNHIWDASFSNLSNSNRSTWCPNCAGKTRSKEWFLQRLKDKVAELGGECLSEEYINNSTPLLFRCKRNHTWSARPNNVLYGKWCKECRKIERRKTANLIS